MIDFSAIESEVSSIITSAATFKSSETGYIREIVPVTQMPACDVSAQGHESRQLVNRDYTIQMVAVIRRQGVDRKDNADSFKLLVEQVCAALEGWKGTSFDVIRNITSKHGMGQDGNGALVRTVIVEFNCLAH